MEVKEVENFSGLNANQIYYLSIKVDALRRKKTQGKAVIYTDRDVELFKLAGFMKREKIMNNSIYKILNYIDKSGLLDRGEQ